MNRHERLSGIAKQVSRITEIIFFAMAARWRGGPWPLAHARQRRKHFAPWLRRVVMSPKSANTSCKYSMKSLMSAMAGAM
jgi:hypothetical protein